MPKQTFFHLPKEKQDTLIQAAKKEFARVPLHEATIANIIKDAKIPRGSFYQYFEGKEDLYYHLLNQISKNNSERFATALKDNNGDIFETFIDTFKFLIQNHRNLEYKNFYKYAFLNMNYKIENIIANNIYKENRKNQYLALINLINTENLILEEDQELHHLIRMIIAITIHNLIQVFVKDLTEEAALKSYHNQIELLKRGITKE